GVSGSRPLVPRAAVPGPAGRPDRLAAVGDPRGARRGRDQPLGVSPPARRGRIRVMATTERPSGSTERDALFSTISGLDVDPLYTPDSVEIDYERDLGNPGAYPFTRGVYPSMYRGRLWTMRQFAGFGTAAETNARFRY